MFNRSIFIIAASTVFYSCLSAVSHTPLPPPDVVSHVELSRYTGVWYEIARYPNRFQKGCTDTSAAYKLGPDGSLTILNSCLKKGALDTEKGKARVVDPTTNAKLKVSFFWPFSGDYWIIDLGADYDYAVISGPDRKYLWILARSPQMDATLYGEILKRLKEQGFDISRLENTSHARP
jgi:apolipoprotein D and lipocalin family protein